VESARAAALAAARRGIGAAAIPARRFDAQLRRGDIAAPIPGQTTFVILSINQTGLKPAYK
jgi:hypothetical protein